MPDKVFFQHQLLSDSTQKIRVIQNQLQSESLLLVGRENLVERLAKKLRSEGKAGLTSSCGMGASRVAWEVYQSLVPKRERSFIVLDARNDLHWCHSLLEFAKAHNLRERYVRKAQDLLPGVRGFLRKQESFLVIDHVHEFERVRPLLDGVNSAHVLILSEVQNSISNEWCKPELLQPLANNETVLWLMNSLNLRSVEEKEQKKLEQLATLLHGIPQVISTVSALLRQGLSLEECISHQQVLRQQRQSDDTFERVFEHALSLSNVNLRTSLAQLSVADGTVSGLLTDQLQSELARVGLLEKEPHSNVLQLPRCYHKYAMEEALPEELPISDSPLLTGNLFYANGLAEQLLSANELSLDTVDLVETVAEQSLLLGAWKHASDLNAKLLRHVREHHAGNVEAQAQLLVNLAHCEQAGQRFALSFRHLNESLNYVQNSLSKAAEVLMDLSENDINEAQIPRALRRIKVVATIHNKLGYTGVNLQRARRLFLRGACTLAQQDAESAVRVLERAHTIQNALLAVDDTEVLKTRTLLTRALFAAKNLDRAEAILREDLALREASTKVSSSEILVTLNSLAELLFHCGKHDESEQLFERVLTMRIALLEENHQTIAETACHIAKLKSARGAYAESNQYFRRAMSIMLERYGESHPEVARVNNDLAESLFTQGKYDQAQRILTRSLRIQETSLRSSDPALGRTRNNLAAIQVALGSYDTAEKLYQRDLQAKRATQPASPLSLAMTANNLGEVIRSQGRLEEAISYFKEALELREKLLKADHPLVAQSLVNLGYVYLLQCKTKQAEVYFQRAINIRKQALSSEHPHLASSLNCLAQIRIIDEQYEAANTFLAEAELICQKVYGDDHPQYGNLLSKTGRVQLRINRKARAELKLLKSKSILEKSVGSNHRFYAEALHGMGELRQSEGKLQEAFPMLERALAILQETTHGPRYEMGELQFLIGKNLRERGETKSAGERFAECLSLWKPLLGDECSRVIDCEFELGQIQVSLHNYAQAELLLQHVSASPLSAEWESCRKVKLIGALADALAGLKKYSEAEALLHQQLNLLGDNADDCKNRLSVYSHLAGVKYLMQDLSGAEPWILKCVELSSEIHGKDHPDTAKHRENLAGLYFAKGLTKEAEVLINQAIHTFEQHYGVEHPTYQTAMGNYARLLRSQNRETDALAIDNRLYDIESRDSHVLDF